jgi:hypothetical protein
MAKRGTVLTDKALIAMRQAVESFLAGWVGEGDSEGLEGEDLERASRWCSEQLDKRQRRRRRDSADA